MEWQMIKKDNNNLQLSTTRVRRGGCWHSNSRYYRSANRNWYFPAVLFNGFGFRVVVEIKGLNNG
jgi:formylglycine-generating enzyme required for sulfatase activity